MNGTPQITTCGAPVPSQATLRAAFGRHEAARAHRLEDGLERPPALRRRRVDVVAVAHHQEQVRKVRQPRRLAERPDDPGEVLLGVRAGDGEDRGLVRVAEEPGDLLPDGRRLLACAQPVERQPRGRRRGGLSRSERCGAAARATRGARKRASSRAPSKTRCTEESSGGGLTRLKLSPGATTTKRGLPGAAPRGPPPAAFAPAPSRPPPLAPPPPPPPPASRAQGTRRSSWSFAPAAEAAPAPLPPPAPERAPGFSTKPYLRGRTWAMM